MSEATSPAETAPLALTSLRSQDRNGPCICGSGHKMKKCCGAASKLAENRRAPSMEDRIRGYMDSWSRSQAINEMESP